MEEFITGYCRCVDKSRIVLVEDGEPDCAYENCPHREACEIGKRIADRTASDRGSDRHGNGDTRQHAKLCAGIRRRCIRTALRARGMVDDDPVKGNRPR